ncbi:hypothetical protein Sango_3008400 [Sesamum angolense]|uniref:Uncharacterized protein n=1 Tax=Sesamum angolense TaxID=2727404 RepID=A0AAE1T3L4_9LAMI|nr:hypothetical protein Sango_3008400 [Sesamum angolense]
MEERGGGWERGEAGERGGGVSDADGEAKGEHAEEVAQIEAIEEEEDKAVWWGGLGKNGDIDVQQICSSDNLADLFTKAFPTAIFKKLVYNIGVRHLKYLN